MDELINIKELIKSMDGYLKRITLALEQTTRVLTAWGTARATVFPNVKAEGENKR